MKKWIKLVLAATTLAVSTSSIVAPAAFAEEKVKVKLGIMSGANEEVWEDIESRLEKEGIDLELVTFTEYTQPNAALADGSIDVNAFQHHIFLENYNKEHKTELVAIGNTFNSPLGIYSQKIKELSELKEGATIAIPNDPTNGGRALRLLQTAGLITVDEAKGYSPTVSDIKENKLNLKIKELEASQTARALPDVDASIINGNFAVEAGLIPTEDSIYIEPVDETSKPYVNLIAVRKEDEDNKVYNKIVEVYQTEETAKKLEEVFKGSYIPAWETFGKK